MSYLSHLTAENVIVVPIDQNNNPNFTQLLMEKNIDQVTMPASLTKILSVVTVLDYGIKMDEIFIVKQCDIVSGSGYNLKAGDQVSLKDLLHDMMLPSSNIAANCVARVIGEKMGGGLQTFVDAMNEKALAIGMTDSVFYNPSGLAHGKQ